MRSDVRSSLTAAVIAVLVCSVAAAEGATLNVSSFPSGAQVRVDGIPTGKVTPMNIALPEGDHVVTVEIPNSVGVSIPV